ncbi:LamG-like jellyroll fold domain-containing protein [Flavobacterium sp. 83]|uniref:LamG-like jellyroll fold domain-containing protein n=1 Tax=Flavobacterium sp. 83 TaxID=1131812 RepID=UPI00068F8192|nr:LamG-like jellyroll fold domain-containing protein [Flavobacterium sp. 83]
MTKIYFKKTDHNLIYLVVLILFFVAPIQLEAQVRKAFTQRTAAASPSKAIYNIKGDFTMLGNTNLTLKTYADNIDNDGEMIYVDVDSDSNTWNSSSANLQLSSENGANPICSTILFAGLYWTGKSDDADTFTVSKQVQNGTQSINTTSTVTNSQSITNTNYSLNVTKSGTGNNRYPVYTFTKSGNTYVFSYTNSTGADRVTLSINGGTATNIAVTNSVSGSIATATLTTPTIITDGTVSLTIYNLKRLTATASATDYSTNSSASVNVSGTIPTYSTVTKDYDKKVVSLKGPLASSYTTITANAADIWYPGSGDDGIYVGYKEITDYVKTNGLGTYAVADIAIKEGTGPTPGYSGGWGIVVIYENPLMNSRAVTLFDGYANENGSFVGDIPISGFIAVNAGQVNMKLGVMASEGDKNKTGDYLKVQQLNTTTYIDLSHSGNTTTNFYNSSIQTGGNTRNPNLVNNTGIDLSMFTIPNTGNVNIANGQTSTNFKYGSSLDKFSIFGFAMSVDSYVPDPKGLISVTSINNVPNPPVLNALPGQTINYSLNITNEGAEATNNTIIAIPIPETVIFNTGGTILYHTYNGYTTTNVPYFDSATNKIIWNLGTLLITANHPEYVYADISFNLNVTTDCAIILNAGCSPEVSLQTATITGIGAISGTSFAKNFFQGYDTSDCHLPIDGSIKVAITSGSCLSALAGPDQIASCGGEYVTLNATAGTTGTWSIVSGPAGGGEIFSNNTNPNTTFYSPNIGVYTLKWTTSSCASSSDTVVVTLMLCNVVNFDGVDDNINFKNVHNLDSGNFSIEVWIKSNATSSNTQAIISKQLSPTATNGYDLKLVNNNISFNWNNNSIIATHAIDTNRWYHIAVTFDGTNYKLYIDGILENTTTGVNPTLNSVDFILGAMSQNTNTPYNYYNGYADELRIWNVPLTVDQIRQMMNQEIINDGSSNVKGVIVPKNISGLSWTNLSGYYQMNRADDILNGYLIDKSGNSKNGKLKGIYVQEPDTAPIPYTSGANGSWETDATWTNYPVWDVPNSVGIDNATKIDWNIVKTSHTITSNSNKIVLGLLVNSNILSAANDSKIEVSSYLKLDGKIDLAGMSQLVQTANSDLDVMSAGSIERDQQGQSNKYNYNYWSSPVSPINTTANNTNYTVTGIMKDGTTTNPQNINWIGGYDGAPTTPISLARYWLYKFDSYANAYANWVQISETDQLRVGQGYTLKGSGAASATQNYTFVGKPNNGTISTNTVGDDQLLLTGNPYPSSLDADAFITDNISSLETFTSPSIDGTLYFWEHYATNNTHILRDYQGGYAARNLTGGLAPSSAGVDFISQSGTPSKGIPNRYIPVGQGFFVNGKVGSGGTVIFNNNQRAFHKENDASNSNVIYKTKTLKDNSWNNNNDPVTKDTFKRIRLGFNSHNDYHRQVLLGFMNEKATDGMDYGYDGLNFDDFPNDMYLLNGENQLVIEGEGFFDASASYPIGVKTDAEGPVKFMIDDIENFDLEQTIFIYDNDTDMYHNIHNATFEINLPAGENNTRFSLRFIDKKLSTDVKTMNDNTITITHLQNGNILVINNNILDATVKKVTLFNSIGQSISTWDIKNQDQKNIQLPIKKISSGVYIAKIQTTKGGFSKKIIIP